MEQVRKFIYLREQVISALPILNEVNFSQYQTELARCSYETHSRKFTEYWFTVHYSTETDNPLIYLVQYFDRDYPDRGIAKGFTVLVHKDPSGYDLFDDAFPDRWDSIEIDTKVAQTIIGVALYQSAKNIMQVSDANMPILLACVPPYTQAE